MTKRFIIPSSSNDTKHEVNIINDSSVVCDCKGFQFYGQCRHIRQVLIYLLNKQNYDARKQERINHNPSSQEKK